jgi:hypothetical protein
MVKGRFASGTLHRRHSKDQRHAYCNEAQTRRQPERFGPESLGTQGRRQGMQHAPGSVIEELAVPVLRGDRPVDDAPRTMSGVGERIGSRKGTPFSRSTAGRTAVVRVSAHRQNTGTRRFSYSRAMSISALQPAIACTESGLAKTATAS